MQGFQIGKDGNYLDKIVYDKNEIHLLAHGGQTEVHTHTYEKDRLFYVYPTDSGQVFEFYYILSGELVCDLDDKKVTIGPNDFFTANGIKEPVHFKTLSEVKLLSFSNEQTFKDMNNDLSPLMELVKQVEKKDYYTEKHSYRVAYYSALIAKKLKITNKALLGNIFDAAYLHDIGKINVPEEILNKPGRLTKEEFDIIKKHPVDGAEMVKGTKYEHLVPAILQHHERLNGSGYPDGLKGEDIILEARIMAVSDTFDAMTEDRAYRKAFSPQYAIDELKQMSGSHYDAEIVTAFEKALKEDGKLD